MVTRGIREGIGLVNQQFMRALSQGDSATVAGCYTPNG
jgi:hypothetical protein